MKTYSNREKSITVKKLLPINFIIKYIARQDFGMSPAGPCW